MFCYSYGLLYKYLKIVLFQFIINIVYFHLKKVIFMALTRSELREKCMVILYQNDVLYKNKNDGDIDAIIKENLEIDNDFVKEIVYGVVTHFNELDQMCNKYMKNWSIDRIDKTGAAILRIATYELKYTDTPPVVIVNEANSIIITSSGKIVQHVKQLSCIYHFPTPSCCPR